MMNGPEVCSYCSSTFKFHEFMILKGSLDEAHGSSERQTKWPQLTDATGTASCIIFPFDNSDKNMQNSTIINLKIGSVLLAQHIWDFKQGFSPYHTGLLCLNV